MLHSTSPLVEFIPLLCVYFHHRYTCKHHPRGGRKSRPSSTTQQHHIKKGEETRNTTTKEEEESSTAPLDKGRECSTSHKAGGKKVAHSKRIGKDCTSQQEGRMHHSEGGMTSVLTFSNVATQGQGFHKQQNRAVVFVYTFLSRTRESGFRCQFCSSFRVCQINP